jgi:hypothetical protein
MTNNSRRDFIKTVSLGSGALLVPGIVEGTAGPVNQTQENSFGKLSELKTPLAIAMWDYSWILRHHRYGEFEDWDKVLNELSIRGYNAIRMDAMPQFVAADTNGKLVSTFKSTRKDWRPALWGNDYTMSFNPREALLEFLPKCKKYGIKVGLATWFMRHGTERTDIFMEEGALLRAWDETLGFLQDNDLLDNVIYIDLLNEYPFWHGYDWLKNELNKRSDIKQFQLDNPDANVPDPGAENNTGNPLKQECYNDFINTLITKLKEKYSGLDFFASLDSGMSLDRIDLTNFGALDYHIWFAHTGEIPGLNEISSRDQTLDLRKIHANLLTYWSENKHSLVKWMDGRITAISNAASPYNIVCGNTEGWGPIFWFDHPDLNWLWVKESAEICVDMALKHENYKFLCTSNFTHPQFKGMWEDVKWHKQITSRIKAIN